MKQLAEIKSLLQMQIPMLVKEYQLRQLGIFGSYVRNEATVVSDLDLLVDFNDAPGLIKYIHLENHLSQIAGVKVDLVMRDALKPSISIYILKEVQYLYEA